MMMMMMMMMMMQVKLSETHMHANHMRIILSIILPLAVNCVRLCFWRCL